MLLRGDDIYIGLGIFTIVSAAAFIYFLLCALYWPPFEWIACYELVDMRKSG